MNKKTILLLWDRLDSIGGVETVLYNIATKINKEKFKVILGAFKDGNVREIFEKEGIKIEIFERKNKYDFKVILNFISYLKNNNIDVIHTHGHYSGIVGRVVGKLLKIKVISTYHLPLDKDGHPKLTKILTQITLPLADFVTFVSKGVQNSFCKNSYSFEEGINSGKKFLTIYNGIDIDVIENYISNLDRKNVRKEFGIEENEILLLNIGRFTEQKGQIYLINAMRNIVGKCPNIKLVIVGEGELKDKLKKLINDNNLENHIKMYPPTKEIFKIMYASDIFILSSIYEGLGLVVIEAMAIKVPVIGTNVTGINEIIGNRVNGLLIEPMNELAIVNAIFEIVANNALRHNLVENAYKTVREKFHVDKMVRSYELLYGSYK